MAPRSHPTIASEPPGLVSRPRARAARAVGTGGLELDDPPASRPRTAIRTPRTRPVRPVSRPRVRAALALRGPANRRCACCSAAGVGWRRGHDRTRVAWRRHDGRLRHERTAGVLRPVNPPRPTRSRCQPIRRPPFRRARRAEAMTVDGLPVVVRVVGTSGASRRFRPARPASSSPTSRRSRRRSTRSFPGKAEPTSCGSQPRTRLVARRAGKRGTREARLFIRADLDHRLQDAPVARGVLGTLVALTALSAVPADGVARGTSR